VVGVVVDAVSGVVQLEREHIGSAPGPGSRLDARYLSGIGSVKGAPGEAGPERRLLLADIEALMSSAEMGPTAN
jgi:purine-binding chemotaxis protein CheW